MAQSKSDKSFVGEYWFLFVGMLLSGIVGFLSLEFENELFFRLCIFVWTLCFGLAIYFWARDRRRT